NQYYFHIIQPTQNKIIIYPIPHFTPLNITINQFQQFFHNQKIVPLKYTPPNFFLLQTITKPFPHKFIFSAFHQILLQALISPLDPPIPSTYNLNPPPARQIYDLAPQAKVQQAY
ncbi:dihydrodipicolinate synthase family protein, partial [Staphylococcus hominis]|uniref:dihydrodipicolinate synthase family protein n=1 Tax=Staphylococcus hominis TaxID=1290 RepID=UPI00164370FC